jgi:hypothetical protein
MNKRANLAAALQTATRGGESVPVTQTANTTPATVTAIGSRAPSRIGKKTVAAHFDPAVSKQLKHLGLERDTSTQALLREAINDLFAKYGKPPIA